ncbi:hypothetical protein N7534_012094 [Penicillium rubens]|nr:hypothetical protein N7534_012094 [Penicillium rubens]
MKGGGPRRRGGRPVLDAPTPVGWVAWGIPEGRWWGAAWKPGALFSLGGSAPSLLGVALPTGVAPSSLGIAPSPTDRTPGPRMAGTTEPGRSGWGAER